MNALRQKPLPAPLLIPLLFWCGGIILSSLIGGVYPLILLIPLVLGLIFAYFLKGRSRILLILLLVLVAGWMRSDLGRKVPSPLTRILATRESISQPIRFEVQDIFSTTSGSYAVMLSELAGIPVRERLILYSERPLSLGRNYRVLARLSPILDDPVIDIYPDRYVARATLISLPTEEKGGSSGFSIPRLRAIFMANLDRNLGDFSGFAKALILSDLSSKNEHRVPLTRGGMIHLIVVSGVHVWFIYGVCIVLLYMFLPRKLSEIISLALILLFAALNGWAPPILRSSLMIFLLIISRWVERPIAPAQVIAISLFIITLIDPAQFFSASLILSYACVCVIMFGVPRIVIGSRDEEEPSWIRIQVREALSLLLMNIMVSICVMPITLFFFGNGSLNGILGNIIGVPLTAVILPLAFLLMLIPGSFVFLPQLRLAYDFLVSLFYWWMNFVGGLPFYREGSYLSAWQAIAWLILAIMLMLAMRGKWQVLKRLAIPALGIWLALTFLPPLLGKTQPGIYIFNSGISDVILIRLPEKTDILIDTGQVSGSLAESQELDTDKMKDRSWLKGYLLRWLSRHGVRDIDYLILTHMHADHVGGVASLVRSVRVKNLLASDESFRSKTWNDLYRTGWFKGTQLKAVTDTMSIFAGGARLKFLHPDRDFHSKKENDRSIVLRLDQGKKRYLFTGDIETTAEDYLLEHYPQELDADYLKVPHHGSKSSSSEDFIEAVSPRSVWITSNHRNRFHFPHTQTLTRYRRYGAEIRLSGDGTIVVPLSSSGR